jgi:stage II sporulation protein AA (anti-sigma F factor antagonist)
MTVTVRRVDNVSVVELEGNLIMGEPVNAFRGQVYKELESGMKNLAIGLTRVTYIDSSGVGALVGAYVSAVKAEGRCVLFGASARVLSLLRIVRLDAAVEIVGDEATAIASLLRPQPPSTPL